MQGAAVTFRVLMVMPPSGGLDLSARRNASWFFRSSTPVDRLVLRDADRTPVLARLNRLTPLRVHCAIGENALSGLLRQRLRSFCPIPVTCTGGSNCAKYDQYEPSAHYGLPIRARFTYSTVATLNAASLLLPSFASTIAACA